MARFLGKRKAVIALAALDADAQVVRARITYAFISRVLYASIPIPVSRDWFDNVTVTLTAIFAGAYALPDPHFTIIQERMGRPHPLRGRPSIYDGRQAIERPR
jgi:hypothetical protein